jgi:lipoyl(octanoyl) transferase
MMNSRSQYEKAAVLDKVHTMKKREESWYSYSKYLRTAPSGKDMFTKSDMINIRRDTSYRENICHWTFSIIDHFELSRNTVAVSMDIFDRYLATLGNECDASLALLVSLSTLYISIKVHEKKKIKLETLSKLSRGQFLPKDIEDMEMQILKTLSWLVHPPTSLDYVSFLLKFLRKSVEMPQRFQIFEVTRYLSELSVCDPFFVDHDKSSVAFASILNVLEEEVTNGKLDAQHLEHFIGEVTNQFQWFQEDMTEVNSCRDRLHRLLAEQQGESLSSEHKRLRAHSPTSITSATRKGN